MQYVMPLRRKVFAEAGPPRQLSIAQGQFCPLTFDNQSCNVFYNFVS
jgi:hypothetical protein